ncbi:DUF4419 domain-containing protein [Pyxidicoccus sp. 3LFB2]
MTTTFEVDDVKPAWTPVLTEPLGSLVKDALWMAPAPRTEVVNPRGVHPLLVAVHQAFAEHRPLVLSPDVVWLTIAHGVAQHIRLNAKALRSRLVRHEGRQTLKVQVTELPRDAEGFGGLLSSFRAQLREALGPGLPRLLSCDFSTSTDIERMAGDVVLMDSMSPYFDYEMQCVCGIPRVTLLGTPEDWQAIRRRIDVIAELDLAWWTSSLVPIADELVRAAEGRPSRKLWKELYKPQKAYAEDQAAGWIARLFPYVGGNGRYETRNPLLAMPHAKLMVDCERETRGGGAYKGPGVAPSRVPSGLSSVALQVEDLSQGTRDTWSLEGGVLTVEVDADGALVPKAGLVVRRTGVSVKGVIERIRGGHSATPAEGSGAFQGVAELTAFYDHVRDATLFPGKNPWHIRPCEEHHEVRIPLSGRNTALVRILVDLPDGTVLALHRRARVRVLRLRADQLVPAQRSKWDPPGTGPFFESREFADEIPMLGASLIEVLSRALDTGGSTALPDLGPFTEHLEPWENDPL